MVAALAAADAGADALVLEKQALVGGSTCMSGGIVWIPNNPLMRAEGVPDSYDDAMAHFEAVVGDVGPCSSFERRHAFLTAGPEMTTFLQQLGVRFVTCPGYSDYYSNLKGGHDVGRGHRAGAVGRSSARAVAGRSCSPGWRRASGMAVMTNEARSLSNYNRSVRSFAVSARVVLRTVAAKARRQALLTNGASLIGQMLAVALDREIPVWTEAPLDDLIVEDGRVVGGAHGARRRAGARAGPAGRPDRRRRLRPQPRDAPAATGATSPTRASGRCPTPATPARPSPPRCGWAPRPR